MISDNPEASRIRSCATCKSVRGRRNEPWNAAKWECWKSEKTVDVVTGTFTHKLCYDLRAHNLNGIEKDGQCGRQGFLYEEYIQPVRFEPAKDASLFASAATDLAFDETTLRSNATEAAVKLAAIKARKKLQPNDPDLDKL